mmetsp:Transcript_10250/g.35686  ORF Transcript_10250/g.35686 Transcript_10250/m.35686 type:complete len:254 (-) Transcript_10250:364-1125(-)
MLAAGPRVATADIARRTSAFAHPSSLSRSAATPAARVQRAVIPQGTAAPGPERAPRENCLERYSGSQFCSMKKPQFTAMWTQHMHASCPTSVARPTPPLSPAAPPASAGGAPSAAACASPAPPPPPRDSRRAEAAARARPAAPNEPTATCHPAPLTSSPPTRKPTADPQLKSVKTVLIPAARLSGAHVAATVAEAAGSATPEAAPNTKRGTWSAPANAGRAAIAALHRPRAATSTFGPPSLSARAPPATCVMP